MAGVKTTSKAKSLTKDINRNLKEGGFEIKRWTISGEREEGD